MRIVKVIAAGLLVLVVLLIGCVYLAPGPTTRFFISV